MWYVVLGLGIAGALLFLLWRLEKAKRLRLQVEKEILEANVTSLRRIGKLERRLRRVQGVERVATEKEISEIEGDILSRKLGEKVEDIFDVGT